MPPEHRDADERRIEITSEVMLCGLGRRIMRYIRHSDPKSRRVVSDILDNCRFWLLEHAPDLHYFEITDYYDDWGVHAELQLSRRRLKGVMVLCMDECDELEECIRRLRQEKQAS